MDTFSATIFLMVDMALITTPVGGVFITITHADDTDGRPKFPRWCSTVQVVSVRGDSPDSALAALRDLVSFDHRLRGLVHHVDMEIARRKIDAQPPAPEVPVYHITDDERCMLKYSRR